MYNMLSSVLAFMNTIRLCNSLVNEQILLSCWSPTDLDARIVSISAMNRTATNLSSNVVQFVSDNLTSIYIKNELRHMCSPG